MKTGRSVNLVLDVGTTGVKSMVFDSKNQVLSRAYQFLHLYRKKAGVVEQHPTEIINASKYVLNEAVKEARISKKNIRALGITTQREAVVAWDKASGKPLHRVISWQDRRTERWCADQPRSLSKRARAITGLKLDPYFSVSKMRWLLDHVPSVSRALSQGRLCLGTLESWLMWNLLEGKPFVADWTNASRTMLFDIRTCQWSEELLSVWNIPKQSLALPKPSLSVFGFLKSSVIGKKIPVRAVCGDQQASAFSAGSHKGVTKVTSGTGTFLIQDRGVRPRYRGSLSMTLLVSGRIPRYGVEQKIEHGTKSGMEILNKPAQLGAFLQELSSKIAAAIKKFPQKPKEIVMDGGWTRQSALIGEVARKTGLTVRVQPIADGTALGVATMLN